LANWYEEATSRSASALSGLIIGSSATWLLSRWRRHRQRVSILCGDARDTVVIQQHLIESEESKGPDGTLVQRPKVLRMRTLGQAELARVVPNDHLAAVLLNRAFRVTTHDTLISMTGAEGSYLLETLMNFVCDRVANAPFEHDRYVMAPCCEPAELAEHQPVTILLVREADLNLFANWAECRDVKVEHGSDGSRVLTLMELAKRHQKEQGHIRELRQAGKRTRHAETMYLLDLALDTTAAAVPVRPVPWGRFEQVLKELNLE